MPRDGGFRARVVFGGAGKDFVRGGLLYFDAGATLEDLREAVTTFEDIVRTARRVFGAAHPLTTGIEKQLQNARVVLRARETPSGEA